MTDPRLSLFIESRIREGREELYSAIGCVVLFGAVSLGLVAFFGG